MLISDEEKKQAIAEYYRQFYAVYREHRRGQDPALWYRIGATADTYAATLERAPWFVLACIEGPFGRADEGSGAYAQANTWASIYPAVGSFMLALFERGLATCLTTTPLAQGTLVEHPTGSPLNPIALPLRLPTGWVSPRPRPSADPNRNCPYKILTISEQHLS